MKMFHSFLSFLEKIETIKPKKKQNPDATSDSFTDHLLKAVNESFFPQQMSFYARNHDFCFKFSG